MIALITCVALIGLMLLGVPVCAAMGGVAAGMFASLGYSDIMAVMAQRIYNGTTCFTMLAIPFFILAGNLMNTGGITDRIFNFAKACVGHWPGGLGQVNIVSSVIFSGMSGAAVADAAGLGMIEMKAMDDAGFPHDFSAGITAGSSTIGPVIPPSIAFVVYSSCASETSVSQLFAAGFIPGFMMAIAMAVWVYYVSKKRNFPIEPKMPWKVRWQYFVKAIPSLLTIVIIVGGIWSGWFTATEASIVACFYALFLSCVVYREVKVKDLFDIVYKSIVTSCKTLFIIAIANFLAYFMTHQRVPNQVINGMLSISNNSVVLMLMIIFILIILGMFLEGTAVILIVAPIFLPIVAQMGVSQLQFGVVMVLASMIGLLTPPVGMSLYAVSSVTNVPMLKLSKEVIPYVVGILIVLLLCAFIPPLCTWLPSIIV
ncbi:MAG: TRAP transporter large permease [Lachnospiraceae bacterium]|nr:TRAP transporter large permease [Lachnospiraceae bacterium]